MHVTKLGARIGARVDGVDLAANIDSRIAAQINAALLEHKVIFFRAQHDLDDDSQLAFAHRLGTPTTAHPTVTSHGERLLPIDSRYDKANSWHTDVTFVDRIPKASILRAITLPPYGGTTTWASTEAAYDRLPAPLRALAENLWAVHTNQYDYATLHDDRTAVPTDEQRSYREEFVSDYYETEHPVVRVHPETGKRVLLLGNFVRIFVGLGATESATLFQLLQDRITKLENTIRWAWEPGDVAVVPDRD
ncbi:MAG TPA: TauD/TfdA family dioxygenase, partial [Mycobacterium sp.]|nr:TauD/TfdA family dioxygenase [Mycobacterium sp.]